MVPRAHQEVRKEAQSCTNNDANEHIDRWSMLLPEKSIKFFPENFHKKVVYNFSDAYAFELNNLLISGSIDMQFDLIARLDKISFEKIL